MKVRSLSQHDFQQWKSLYVGYIHFYQNTFTDETIHRTFNWILDENHLQQGIVAEDDSELIGLAHFQVHPNPMSGTHRMFLNDLFVRKDSRRSGCATLLIKRLSSICIENGYASVRWLTSQDNHKARSFYDKYASVIPFVTYQMEANENVP